MTHADMLWNYTIEQVIDDSTKLVKNIFTNEYMILKIMSPSSYNTINIIATINSTNIMKIFSVRLVNNLCFVLCEYVNGKTIEEIVSTEGFFGEKEAVRVMNDICNGLQALHEHGIIHKDIKPSNVMISNNKVVKIVDFDISRIEKINQNKDTEVLGTVGFASPEHFGFSQTDQRADIYSCGVLLNYMLTGKIPSEYIYSKGYLNRVINKCIEVDKDKRYKDTFELKQGLKGKLMPDERRFRPLPGFRGKHVLPKILMVIVYIVYIFMFVYTVSAIITQDPGVAYTPLKFQIYNFLIFFIFLTLLPYLLFGNVGQLAEKISPRNPRNGRYILNFFAILSFVIAFLLFYVQI